MNGQHSSSDNGWSGMALMRTGCRDGDPSIGSGRLLHRPSEIPSNIRLDRTWPTWREQLFDPLSSSPSRDLPTHGWSLVNKTVVVRYKLDSPRAGGLYPSTLRRWLHCYSLSSCSPLEEQLLELHSMLIDLPKQRACSRFPPLSLPWGG